MRLIGIVGGNEGVGLFVEAGNNRAEADYFDFL